MKSIIKKIINFFEKKNEYSSCCFLEYGGIHFISDRQFRPCCTLSDYSYETLSALTADCRSDSFDLESYTKLINKIKSSNKTKNSICKNCGYFVKKAWPKLDSSYLINHRIILSFFTLCNFRCCYCTIDNNDYTKKPVDIMPILSDMIRRRLVNPNAIIEFSGGEPALLDYHAELIELFKKNGNRIIFISNASTFSEAIYDYLSISKGSYLLTSLDSGTEEKFKEIRGVNLFQKVKDNLRRYAENKNENGYAQISLKYILLESNLDDNNLSNFIDFCIEINPLKVVLAIDFVTTLRNGTTPNQAYYRVVNKAKEVKEIILKNNLAVEMATYDLDSYGMFYPEGVQGDTRVFRTFLE